MKLAKAKAIIEVSEEVENLFERIQEFVTTLVQEFKPAMKVQIEKDFRGKPVISIRVRKENVEFEQLPTLRYPE